MPLSPSPSHPPDSPDHNFLASPPGPKIAQLASIDAPQIDKLAALLIINNGGIRERGEVYATNINPAELIKSWFLDGLQVGRGKRPTSNVILENGKKMGNYFNSRGRYLITLDAPLHAAGDIAAILTEKS